jgi:hypothetical protein
MKVDVDFLIGLMTKYTKSDSSEELGEQDAADAGTSSTSSTGGASSSGGGGKNNVTTWSGTVGAQLKRGHANPLGNTKWESGLTRGPANQLT